MSLLLLEVFWTCQVACLNRLVNQRIKLLMLVEQTVHDSGCDVEDIKVFCIIFAIYQTILLDHQRFEIYYLVVLLSVRVHILRTVDFNH